MKRCRGDGCRVPGGGETWSGWTKRQHSQNGENATEAKLSNRPLGVPQKHKSLIGWWSKLETETAHCSEEQKMKKCRDKWWAAGEAN